MYPGPQNSITDINGLLVGNAQDMELKSGTTVLLGEKPFTCSISVMGGAPGAIETELLSPDKLVNEIDALTLSGGSAFGLTAANAVRDQLANQGRGIEFGGTHIPIVPGAILFDLMNGGDKSSIPNKSNTKNPYHNLGVQALRNCSKNFPLGTVGAGTGATTATLKGGLGTASTILPNGIIVGALVAVNAIGNPVYEGTPHFRASAYEKGSEFGGLGFPSQPNFDTTTISTKISSHHPQANTTIGIIATNANLSKTQAKRLATTTHDGFAIAIYPCHTPFDGDLIFSVATGEINLSDPEKDTLFIGAVATTTMARAISRAVYHAKTQESDNVPSWQQKYNTLQ